MADSILIQDSEQIPPRKSSRLKKAVIHVDEKKRVVRKSQKEPLREI